MALSTNLDQTPKSDSTNPCCDQWKKKCSKLLESRNVLRQALKVLEPKIIECEKENSKLKELIELEKGRTDSERKKAAEAFRLLQDEKNNGAENENKKETEIGRLKGLIEAEKIRSAESCRLLDCEKNKVSQKEKEIGRLKALLEERADSMSKKDAEVFKLLGEEKNKVAEKEKEIGRLKELLEEKKRRVDSESNKETGIRKLLGEEKNKVLEKEKEIGRLKELLEEKKRRVDSESNKNAEISKLLGEEKNKVADKENEIGGLKDLLVEKTRRVDSESNKNAEIFKLLGEEKNKVAEKEREIGRLKELLEEKRKRADSESNRDAEVCKLLVEEKNKVAEKEKEIGRLKELLQEKTRRADSLGNKDAEVYKLFAEEKNKVTEREKEIGRLKELVEEKKRKGDSETKKAAEACKLLEEERKKTTEKGEIARIEAEKAEKYRIQIGQLEKQVNQAKTKLASEISTFKESTKKFEAEKRKLLAEKRNAESEMTNVNERLEVQKQKVDDEKRRADAEMVKLEEQKALAEENWNKFMNEKCLTDQMSQKLEENKQMIEDLKRKIHELSSLTKPVEMAADSKVKAESTEVKLLKNKLKLEKLRAKHSREKCKLEASRYGILQHELRRLKVDFIQFLHRLDILDGSFPPVAESMHGHKKFENMLDMQNSNVMRQICNPNLSEMHSRFENELLEPCCTTMNISGPLRKNMQNTPLLTPGGHFSETITGIGSKLEPLVRGSKRTKLQSSAVNSSTESFSDGQLMGSQDATTFPVTASTKLSQEIFNAKQSICRPSDKSVDVHHRKRKRMHDTVEYIANLSSEKLSDLHCLLYRKVGKCLEGGKGVIHHLNNLQEEDKRAHKKKKKSRREKVDVIPRINRGEKKGTEEANTGVYDDVNVCRHTSCPAPHTLETTQACGERICDAANNFDTFTDGSYMKLLELENTTIEECFRKAMDFPLSPSLPELEFRETFEEDNLMNPSLEEALQKDMLTSRTDLLTSHVHTAENSRTAFQDEDAVGFLSSQIPEFCVVFSNIEDNSNISRILIATKNCIAHCNLATKAGWAFRNILTALKMEEKLSQKEKVSVLLSVMLFNFAMTATKTFGKLSDGKLLHCLQSYSEHIHTVMSDAETRIMFIENYSLHELLGLIEDFLVEGKIIVNNRVDTETLSCDLRANDFLDCGNELSSNLASSEQLVAASIILASVCAATDYVGFICDTSYHILLSCKWDSLMVLTILHIFAYLGGEKFFNMDSFGLMVTVLKSLIKFLEDGNLSVASTCLPSINQLHAELCMNVKCPFREGAESIDAVACLLLEEIKRVDLSDSRLMSDNYNARECYHHDAVQPVVNKNSAVPCSKKCLISATQPDVLKNVNFCCLNDVLSLVELVANKMSWHWADTKLVPQLLNILDSCVEENFAIRIIVLLSQLGRIGVDVGGYEDQGVGNLRSYLSVYLCCTSSKKAGPSLQSAAAIALFDLLPLDFEALFLTDINLPAHSKSVSDKAETLRKWFSGLAKDQQELLSDIFKRADLCNK